MVRLIALTQVWTRTDAGDAHLLHVPLHSFTIDCPSFSAQLSRNTPRAVEGISGVDLINAVFKCYLLGRWRDGLIVETRTTEAQELGLHAEWRVPPGRTPVSFDQGQPLTSPQG